MLKIVNFFKGKSLSSWALILSFTAITAVEFSYVLGGLRWLDSFIFLLMPAFILLIIQLISNCNTSTKSYCVAFTILVACVVFSFYHLSKIEVGTLGDQYHISKTVALSINNSFFTQLQYGDISREFFISDFVESIWGIFWRWTQWDFVIVFSQALPIFLLWHQLVRFFQNQKIAQYPALLATIVVMSLEILWCQQASPFIDSIVGILVGINLLLCYSFLTPPYERRFSYLAGLVFVSSLCVVAKPTGLAVGLLGLIIAFVLGFRFLDLRGKILLPLVSLPSLIYVIYHQIQVQIQKGSFFYPYVGGNNKFQFFESYPQLYTPLKFYSWIKDHAYNSKILYVLSSWLSDYRLDSYITPAPYKRGNGLVFTYVVLTVLVLWIFQCKKNILKNKLWTDPRLFIFVVIFVYYYSFEGSIDVRFALGYNILILSWGLVYLWQLLEKWSVGWLRFLPTMTISLLLLMSVGSYGDGIRGWRFETHIISPLFIQNKIFPQIYDPEMRKTLIQKLMEEHSV